MGIILYTDRKKSIEVEELKSQLKYNPPPKTSRGTQVSDEMKEKVARLQAKLRGKKWGNCFLKNR